MTHLPELTENENERIEPARQRGFAEFFPCIADAKTQAQNTPPAAEKFQKNSNKELKFLTEVIDGTI